MELFSAHRGMISLAVIEDQRPIGLINRNIFLLQMSKPFHRELYDKKSCIAFMDKEPLIVDEDMDIDTLTGRTIEYGEKALTDGFIVTRENRFVGLGNGLSLMRAVAGIQAEKNRQTMQSIEYASVIQRAMLRAPSETLAAAAKDCALAWEPRDVVGGDFYHFSAHENGWFGAVADCTGHGVPGAFMTLIASSALIKAIEQLGPRDPAALLAAVNRSVKTLLSQVRDSVSTPQSDDGLDAAFFWFDAQRRELCFSGARIAMHILKPGQEQFEVLPGQRKGVGYIDSPADHVWTQSTTALPEGSLLFITTDGLTDQIGGPRQIAFGKRRTADIILAHRADPATLICEKLQQALAQWQNTGREPQNRRDDLTLFFARI
ncbi:SpoIIE family protein phosphatase [Bordetella sp. FB-8]|uniref:SpoIIE family protein phosphatase n=1 Tax=Bordetella sp. FB-8 TaxID=1159870 RepID=UPI00037AFAE8|nr:SpoIIE family protein phosphatase [Bordetella sp. FB-8]